MKDIFYLEASFPGVPRMRTSELSSPVLALQYLRVIKGIPDSNARAYCLTEGRKEVSEQELERLCKVPV